MRFMDVRYARAAQKTLRRMPERDRTALMALSTYAATGRGDVVKLAGRDVYRVRRGGRRVLFTLSGRSAVVHVVHQEDAY